MTQHRWHKKKNPPPPQKKTANRTTFDSSTPDRMPTNDMNELNELRYKTPQFSLVQSF